MLKYLYRKNKNYSRYNIIKQMLLEFKPFNDVYILLPFSKNVFFKNFFKRDKIVNDFFISNYDTYVYDRKKVGKTNPRAWWKYFQDYINFKFSKFLISDTQEHFNYWESLFGKSSAKHLVLPVFADKTIYYPTQNKSTSEKIKIIFYGYFIPLHGIDVILNALKILEDKEIPYEATIIGTGQTFKEMMILYKNLGLENVQIIGEIIEEGELANLIREHDVVLGIFGQSKKARSVIPNKVYQGLACKKTVVTMYSSAIEEFFNNNDLVLCENNDSSLADSLIQLIDNQDLIFKYQDNGYKKFLDLYSSKQTELINFLKEV